MSHFPTTDKNAINEDLVSTLRTPRWLILCWLSIEFVQTSTMLAGNDMGGVAAVLSQKITGEQAVSCAAPGTLLRRFIPADAGNIKFMGEKGVS